MIKVRKDMKNDEKIARAIRWTESAVGILKAERDEEKLTATCESSIYLLDDVMKILLSVKIS